MAFFGLLSLRRLVLPPRIRLLVSERGKTVRPSSATSILLTRISRAVLLIDTVSPVLPRLLSLLRDPTQPENERADMCTGTDLLRLSSMISLATVAVAMSSAQLAAVEVAVAPRWSHLA